MLKFVVCDDNSVILSKISKMLETIFINNAFDASIVLRETNGYNVISFIKSNSIDVLLLDIDLKGNGLQRLARHSKAALKNSEEYFKLDDMQKNIIKITL